MGSDVRRFPDLRREADRLWNQFGRSIRSLPIPHPQQHPRGVRSFAADQRFAALSFGRFWRWSTRPFRRSPSREQESEELGFPIKLNPEDQKATKYFRDWRAVHGREFAVDGKMLSAEEALKKLDKELNKLNRSVGMDTFKDLNKRPDAMEVMKLIPTEFLRRDAPKQQLKKFAEDRLELTRIATGLCDKGLWGGKEFAFGIFAKTPILQHVMRRWKKVPFLKAVENDYLLVDIMENAPAMELTLMVVPSRKLSIHRLQWEYQYKLIKCLQSYTPINREILLDIKAFVDLFDPDRVRGTDWVEGTKVKADTQFIFSMHPDRNLSVEAINPGALKDQKTTLIGTTDNHFVQAAVFGLFLGKAPMDGIAKCIFTRNMQHLANGGKLEAPDPRATEAEKRRAARHKALEMRRLERMAVFVNKQVPATMTPVPK